MIRHLLLVTFCISFTIAGHSAFAAQKDYHDQDLKGKDFTQGTLNNADFSDAILKGCNFKGASLKNANFKGADVAGAWIIDADCTGADFREVKGPMLCSRTHFDKANMEGIVIQPDNATFKGANLKDCKMSGYIYNNDFSGAILTGANMRGMVVNTDSNRWKGATYDDDTAWPDGFDPVAAGAVLVKMEAAKPAQPATTTTTQPAATTIATQPASTTTTAATTTTATAPATGGTASVTGKYVSEDKTISCDLNADGTMVFHEGDQAMNGTYKVDGDSITLSVGPNTLKIKVEGNALISPQSDKKLIKQ